MIEPNFQYPWLDPRNAVTFGRTIFEEVVRVNAGFVVHTELRTAISTVRRIANDFIRDGLPTTQKAKKLYPKIVSEGTARFYADTTHQHETITYLVGALLIRLVGGYVVQAKAGYASPPAVLAALVDSATMQRIDLANMKYSVPVAEEWVRLQEAIYRMRDAVGGPAKIDEDMFFAFYAMWQAGDYTTAYATIRSLIES